MQALHRFAAVAILSLSALTGCVAEEGSAPFALYSGSGELVESCGATGLLAAPDTIQMRVSIRLVGGSGIHWDQGDGVTMGTHDGEGNFTLSRYVRSPLGANPDGNANAAEQDTATDDCQVERTMVVDGTLRSLGTDGTYDDFVGVMRNSYAAFPGTDCSSYLEGEEPIADALPCTVTYNIEGARD